MKETLKIETINAQDVNALFEAVCTDILGVDPVTTKKKEFNLNPATNVGVNNLMSFLSKKNLEVHVTVVHGSDNALLKKEAPAEINPEEFTTIDVIKEDDTLNALADLPE